MKEPHVVPLSPPAVALMRRLRDERIALDGKRDPAQLIFPGLRGKAIGDVTMMKAIRDMKITVVRLAVDGFRRCGGVLSQAVNDGGSCQRIDSDIP